MERKWLREGGSLGKIASGWEIGRMENLQVMADMRCRQSSADSGVKYELGLDQICTAQLLILSGRVRAKRCSRSGWVETVETSCVEVHEASAGVNRRNTPANHALCWDTLAALIRGGNLKEILIQTRRPGLASDMIVKYCRVCENNKPKSAKFVKIERALNP